MILSQNSDLLTLLYSILIGMGLSIIYDLIKASRQIKIHNKILIFIEDIIFSIFAGFITYFLQFVRVNGEIRWFVLTGELIGFIISRMLITKFSTKLFKRIYLIVNKFVIFPIKIIFKLISTFFNEKLDSIILKIENILKKSLQHIGTMLYNKSKRKSKLETRGFCNDKKEKKVNRRKKKNSV